MKTPNSIHKYRFISMLRVCVFFSVLASRNCLRCNGDLFRWHERISIEQHRCYNVLSRGCLRRKYKRWWCKYSKHIVIINDPNCNERFLTTHFPLTLFTFHYVFRIIENYVLFFLLVFSLALVFGSIRLIKISCKYSVFYFETHIASCASAFSFNWFMFDWSSWTLAFHLTIARPLTIQLTVTEHEQWRIVHAKMKMAMVFSGGSKIYLQMVCFCDQPLLLNFNRPSCGKPEFPSSTNVWKV